MTAGRVADLNGAHKLYDPALQLHRQNEIRRDVLNEDVLLPFNHPPLLVPLLRPLSRASMDRSFLIWTAFTLLLLALSAGVLTSGLLANGASRLELTAIRLAALSFFPVAVVVAQGQDTSMLLIAVAAWAVLFRAHNDLLAGLMLSLASIRPHLAIGLALPFLFARRRVFWGFVAGVAVLATYSIGLVGFHGVIDYLELLRETSIGGTMLIAETRMPNLLGVLHRLGGIENRVAVSLAAWLTWIGFMVGTSVWWRSLGSRVSSTCCGLLVAGTVFLVPHIHLHDLAILTVPMIIAAGDRLHGHRSDWMRPVTALALASLALTVMAVSPSPVFDIFLAAAILAIGIPLIRDLEDHPLSRSTNSDQNAGPGASVAETHEMGANGE